MKSLKFKMMSLVLLMSHTLSFASLNDIRGTRYELKSIKKEDKFAFLLCDNKAVPQSCQYIGKIGGYSKSELEEISKSELIEARIKTGGVVVVASIGVIVGFFSAVATAAAYSGATAASLTASEVVTTIGVGSVITGVGASPMLLDKLNPWHQYAQAEVLSTEGLLTTKIFVKSDKEILEIANLMNEILEYP